MTEQCRVVDLYELDLLIRRSEQLRYLGSVALEAGHCSWCGIIVTVGH